MILRKLIAKCTRVRITNDCLEVHRLTGYNQTIDLTRDLAYWTEERIVSRGHQVRKLLINSTEGYFTYSNIHDVKKYEELYHLLRVKYSSQRA